MAHRPLLASLALAAFAIHSTPAGATDRVLVANGQWSAFAVDSLLSAPGVGLGWIDDAGDALSFSFVIGAGSLGSLGVVDAAFAGDTFTVSNFGASLGSTSAVPVGTFETSPNFGTDFDAAFADARFSHGIFSLLPGSYRISGSLLQSVTFAGERLDATAGALRLTVAPIPEPDSLALLLAGFGAVGALVHRRTARV